MDQFARRWMLIVGTACAAVAVAAGAPGAELQGAESLRAAIEDLAETFSTRYPNGREYLARLDGLERRAARASGAQAAALRAEFEGLKREALIANPLVRDRPILFVVRRQYGSDHHSTARV